MPLLQDLENTSLFSLFIIFTFTSTFRSVQKREVFLAGAGVDGNWGKRTQEDLRREETEKKQKVPFLELACFDSTFQFTLRVLSLISAAQ